MISDSPRDTGLAPKALTLHARNPVGDLAISGRAFGSVASAHNSHDRGGGRRPGAQRDCQNFTRNYESWSEAGSRAERIVAERPREPERLEALAAFVARRKAEGGAPADV